VAAPRLFLASTSPRRRELLQQLGLSFDVLKIDVDETRRADETPEAYVERLARDKAHAGLAQVSAGAVVIAADTTVALANDELGKPASLAEAYAMWARLSGQTHRVLTGVAVATAARMESGVVTTQVHFRDITMAEQTAYWASGEPQDKAGGYAIQGKGAVFVRGIEGSYSNVVGLPLAETAAMLASFGFSIWDAGHE
jgi:septum formation protein